jgi:hypothetical protein
MLIPRTITYGDAEVPIIERFWKVAERLPYRKTYKMQVGEHWTEADVTSEQYESYVMLEDGEVVPVGAAIARELVSEGALSAVFTELWGRLVLVNSDLVCVQEDGQIKEILDAIRSETGGRLGGLPDVIAVFFDGRIVMREAKVTKKDRLQKNQHDFARVAQKLFGNKLDLAVVEWGYSSR